jgi:hypothetical protein
MKRTAKAVAAAAAAAAPLTLAAPALASTEAISDVPNLVLSANSYRTFMLNGGDYSLTQTSGGPGIKASFYELYGGDYTVLSVETLSVGTATFSILRGGAEIDAFTVNVIDAGADGRIDISDVIKFTKLQPDLADTAAEIKALMGGIEHKQANHPPMQKAAMDLPTLNHPAPIGGSVSFSIAPYFYDMDKDAITFELASPTEEMEIDDYSAYFDVDSNGLVTVTVPSEAEPGIVPLIVRVTDSSGASELHLLPIPVYPNAFVWDTEAIGAEGELVTDLQLGPIGAYLGFSPFSTQVAVTVSGYGGQINGSAIVDGTILLDLWKTDPASELELEEIGTISFSLTLTDTTSGRVVTVPLTLYRNTAPNGPDASISYTYELELTAEELATGEFNEPIDLYALFNDPDVGRGDELDFEITSSSPSTAESSVFIDGEGLMTFGFESSMNAVFTIEATDEFGESDTVDILVGTNAPPFVEEPEINVSTEYLYPGWYKYLSTVFEDENFGDLDFTFGPASAVSALDPEITSPSSSIAVQINEVPTTMQTLIITSEDTNGRKATAKLIVGTGHRIAVDKEEFNTVKLDDLFQDPTGDTFTYFVDINYDSGSPVQISYDEETEELNINLNNELGNDQGEVVVRAENAVGVVLDKRYFYIDSKPSSDDWVVIGSDWGESVTESVYEGTLSLGGLFSGAGPTDSFYFYNTDSELQLFDLNVSAMTVKVRYLDYMLGHTITILRKKADGDFETETVYLSHTHPV